MTSILWQMTLGIALTLGLPIISTVYETFKRHGFSFQVFDTEEVREFFGIMIVLFWTIMQMSIVTLHGKYIHNFLVIASFFTAATIYGLAIWWTFHIKGCIHPIQEGKTISNIFL